MSKKVTAMLVASAAALVAGSMANAAFFAIGTSSSVAPTSNANVVLAPGESVTLYLWGRSTANASTTGSNIGAPENRYVNQWQFRLEGTGLAPTAVYNGLNPAVSASLPPAVTPGAAGSPTGNGMTFQALNTFGVQSGAAQTGINGNLVYLASFTLTVPAGATDGAVSNLFLVHGSGITEGAVAGTGSVITRHALGFGGTPNSSTLGNPPIAGVDGNVINSAGTTTNNTNGYSAATAAGARTTTADAIITVSVPVTGPSVTLTPGGVAPATVPGNGVGYLPTLANGGAFQFAGSNTGSTLVAFDLSGASGVPDGLILPAGAVLAPDALAVFNGNLGGGFDFVVNFGAIGSGPYTAAITGLANGVTVGRIAAIPEPAALGLLAPVALLAARRRRA